MPPKPTNHSARYVNVTTTFSDDEYAQLLAWIEKQPDPKPARAAAVREFVLAGLGLVEADPKTARKP